MLAYEQILNLDSIPQIVAFPYIQENLDGSFEKRNVESNNLCGWKERLSHESLRGHYLWTKWFRRDIKLIFEYFPPIYVGEDSIICFNAAIYVESYYFLNIAYLHHVKWEGSVTAIAHNDLKHFYSKIFMKDAFASLFVSGKLAGLNNGKIALRFWIYHYLFLLPIRKQFSLRVLSHAIKDFKRSFCYLIFSKLPVKGNKIKLRVLVFLIRYFAQSFLLFKYCNKSFKS